MQPSRGERKREREADRQTDRTHADRGRHRDCWFMRHGMGVGIAGAPALTYGFRAWYSPY